MLPFAPPLDALLSIEDLRQRARRMLPRSVFEFIDGGAEDEITLRENRAGFERLRFVPRVLVDVREPRTGTGIVHGRGSVPLVVAPMGSCALARPGADLALARAAAAHGIPYVLSTMATTSIERMADAVQGELWFQLYVLRDRALNHALMARAHSAG